MIPGEVRLVVECQRVREQFAEAGDSFLLRLRNCNALKYHNRESGTVTTDLEALNGMPLEMFLARIDGPHLDVHCSNGVLRLEYETEAVELDGGRQLTHQELYEAAGRGVEELLRQAKAEDLGSGMTFDEVAELETETLLRMYGELSDPEDSAVAVELWDRVVPQGTLMPEAPRLLEFFIARLRKPCSKADRMSILDGLALCLARGQAGDDELSVQVVAAIAECADLVTTYLREDCEAGDWNDGDCDFHGKAIELAVLLNHPEVDDAIVRWIQKDAVAHSVLWPHAGRRNLWDRFAESDLRDCVERTPFSWRSLASSIRISRGYDDNSEAVSRALRTISPKPRPSVALLKALCGHPGPDGEPVVRECFRRSSELVVDECAGCDLLRVLWNDERNGWEDRATRLMQQISDREL